MEAALRYVKARFPVLPLCWPVDGTCGCGRNHEGRAIGKVPLLTNGLTDATIEEARVRDYWTRWPSANIGVSIPPGYFVLDVDIEHNGYENLGKLQDSIGELPKTLQITTGTGGAHLWYKTRTEIRNTARLAGYEGLDIRGVGGYVVVPPSVHRNGSFYEKSKTWPGPITIAPGALIELCTRKISQSISTGDGLITEGARNDTLTRIAGAMRRRGAPGAAIYEALRITNEQQCQPPLDDTDVRTIANSINRYPPEERSSVGYEGFSL